MVGLLSLFINSHTGAIAQPAKSFIEISAGVGLDMASDGGARGTGSGFFGQVEYIRYLADWVSAHGYGGAQITEPDKDSCGPGVSTCNISSQMGFLGTKLRLMVPTPLISPFFELGVGISVGRMQTFSGHEVAESSGGLTYHIPVAAGLAFGKSRSYAVQLAYLFHPKEEHVCGGIGLGLTFPLEH